ncbi:unnamed protein product [Adineta ricciae]|uniref:protein-tyrosine-phosphatase n=1 Tax=Adineta ricciae TaxID=249248 RepID=A0A815E7N4_ADIRI|nr:unnamed protein product [Adineta ricciae]CAF1346955.1 unnamed protein product [Adineta ricciae]
MFSANKFDHRICLGNLQSALNLPPDITHVLAVLDFEPILKRDDASVKIKRLYINSHDVPHMDLLGKFEQCYDFITQALEENDANQVLIHCYAGRSRSATIALMYLMKKYQYAYDEAEKHLKEKRPDILVNEGFKRQLKLFFDLGYTVDRQHKRCLAHQLECLRLKYIETYGYERKRQIKQQFLALLPSEKSVSPFYVCKQCQTNLFTEKDIIHKDGNHAYLTYISLVTEQFGPYVRGDLKCPNCEKNLGSYQLDGKTINDVKQEPCF